jgi:hypothetical protein
LNNNMVFGSSTESSERRDQGVAEPAASDGRQEPRHPTQGCGLHYRGRNLVLPYQQDRDLCLGVVGS